MTAEANNSLFIYVKDESGKFWVFDGGQFHHFFLDGTRFWYIRTQAYLPGCTVGRCITLSRTDRQALQSEALRHRILLPFFETLEECNGFALVAEHEQFVFDRSFPAGYFEVDSPLQRGGEEEE